MTDITFALEDAPEKVTRPHKYDGVIQALISAPEGQQIAAVFPDEAQAESYLTAVRTLARNAGHSIRTSERKQVENGIKIGVVLVPRRTRRTSEEVAAEKAAAALAAAEAEAKAAAKAKK